MKKSKIYLFLYGLSLLFILGFVIRLGADYWKYNEITNSAPFYTYIIVRALEFILPSIIIFMITKIMKKDETKTR